ncbi:MAG: hypothetical protein ACLQBL_02210 [Polyangiaceae bacterium]|jgi:hypothetical protein
MSMKRSRAKSSGSGRASGEDESSYFAKPKEPEKTWAEHLDGKGDDAFLPYAMTSRFTKGQLLTHPKFGKGIVVHVEGQRIEVLFEDGPKKLGHA